MIFSKKLLQENFCFYLADNNIRQEILNCGGGRAGYRFPPIPHQNIIQRVYSCFFAHNISCGLCL